MWFLLRIWKELNSVYQQCDDLEWALHGIYLDLMGECMVAVTLPHTEATLNM